MIDFWEARRMVLSHARSFGREEVPLEEAFGRVLSETVRADRDYPPFERATMDGYGLRYADLELGIRRFRVIGIVYAGRSMEVAIGAGECYKIMTGGAVPVSANIVVRRENVQEGADFIELLPASADTLPAGVLPAPPDPSFPWRPLQNIARRGEDLEAGQVVIDHPCICEPAIIGLLATLGRSTVTVERLPRVSILTTGDEIVGVGESVGPVTIRNSNRWLLEAALRKRGVIPATIAHAPDDPALLRAQLQRLLEDDVVILCGGVSAGDVDYVPSVLESAGVRKLFHKISIRPGKPAWCGLTPRGKMVFALPGNPFSTFVHMTMLIQPFVQACYGIPLSEPLGLPLGSEKKKRTPLDEFFPVEVHGAPVKADPVDFNGSGDIRLGRTANALALHPAGSPVLSPGTEVLCYSFV